MWPRPLIVFCVLLSVPTILSAQSQPASDPQALSYAAQSIATLTGGNAISDVTLTGTVSWNAGADTGTATLQALGTGESRMDLVLSGGTRSEVRDAQTGIPHGQWSISNGSSGAFALHNCWTDAVWFFTPLSSLAAGPNVVLSFIGQESKNGATVQHVRSYVYQSTQGSGSGPNPQQLSTMDFYLDASTLLPVAVDYFVHPDDDAGTDLSVEIDFAQYQSFNGFNVATSIQRYLQGGIDVDITVQNASFNTGLPLSNFSVN